MTPNFDTYVKKLLLEMPDISLQSKTVMANNKPLKSLKLEDIKENIVFIRQDKPNMLFREGYSLVYFMDSAESAKRMAAGEIPYKMVPRGTFYSGGSPITDIWKKKFHQPGHEHILGMIEANVMPDEIYIDMMTVRPKYKQNSITSKMISLLQASYPDAELKFSDPTDQGKSFIKKYKETN